MRLLYFYLDFTKKGERPEGYRGHKRCELNFGVGDVYTLERLGGNQVYYRLNRTQRAENAQIEPGFWGDERLYNISAIVGENGTGKTTLMHAMVKVLKALYEGIPQNRFPFDFICLIQDREERLYLIHSQGMEVCTSDFKCCKETPALLRKTKLLYFSNTLSLAELDQYDQIFCDAPDIYTAPIYDCSLLAGMLDAQEASSVGSKKRLLEDQLYTYFTFESYQEARYLFDRNQRMLLLRMREQGYPVPFPRALRLHIRSAMEHLQSVLKLQDESYLTDEMKEWTRRYSRFRRGTQNRDLVLAELSLNCVAGFLNMARRKLKDKAAGVTLPEEFDGASSYITCMDFVISASDDLELEGYYQDCGKYIAFLWNNAEHIRTYWEYNRNGICHIALGDRLDPILQELMIRFVDLNRAISRSDYFVTYSWGLSSGESILLRIFTKLRYLLNGASYDEESAEYITAESARKAARAERKEAIVNHTRNGEECDCDSVLLFLDEADLSLHPEWQRMFVATLAEYLPRLYQAPYYRGTNSACRDIQIIMTTHSPLMLGDFPAAAVLYLKKDKDGFVTVEQNSALQPFGQNLYTILKDGFYLQKGALGALAQKKIKDILEDVKTVKALELSTQTDPHGVQRALDNWERRLEGHRKKTLRYLPKGILRGKLEEELAAALARLDRRWDPERRERKKQELSQEIARLQRQLYELENGGETLP